MQRRKFLKTAGVIASLPAANSFATTYKTTTKGKEFYEWRIYTMQENPGILDSFYKEILIPAYSRQGIKIGAFKPYKKENQDTKRYYLFVYPSLEVYQSVKKNLWEDTLFVEKSKPFYDRTARQPIYMEFETYLCEAFDRIPHLMMPDKDRTLFEFRFYHSPNEEANKRKVNMFNIEEIDLFDKVGINPVCYGDIWAGPKMPALIYLTWYKDEETRNRVWGEFVKHPEWIRMRDLPQYAHTATNNTSVFLSPMEYSGI